jgi:hypothetical protein
MSLDEMTAFKMLADKMPCRPNFKGESKVFFKENEGEMSLNKMSLDKMNATLDEMTAFKMLVDKMTYWPNFNGKSKVFENIVDEMSLNKMI